MKGVADALLFPGKELLRTIPERPKNRTSLPTRTSGKNQWFQNLLLILFMAQLISGYNLVANVTDAECVQC